MAENVNLKTFNEDINALRGFIRSSKIEEDPYKIIILAERFILEYGTKWTRETVDYLRTRGIKKEDKLAVILDLVQSQKTIEQLLIFKHYNNGRKKG